MAANYRTLTILADLLCLIIGVSQAYEYGDILRGKGCHFPVNWRGDWYQNNFQLQISESEISSPSNMNGKCFKREHHKYIIEHSQKSCYMCIVFTPRHRNVIQYKISDCFADGSLKDLCSKIAGDSVLFTLLRLSSRPVKCPFQGSYSFTYNAWGINCNKRSEIVPCADESKFKFVYKSCEGSDDAVQDFYCLATWHSDHAYLYAKRVGPSVDRQQDSYRCYTHTKIGLFGYMSQSVDPSCRLRGGPRGGDFRMSLVKDTSNWPEVDCTYPHYLTKDTLWRDISGEHLLKVDSDQQTLRLQRRPVANGVLRNDQLFPTSILSFRCLNSKRNVFESRADDFLVHTTTDQCSSHYRCLRLIKKSRDVVELVLSKDRHNATVSCTKDSYRRSSVYIFIRTAPSTKVCPHRGIYSFTDRSCSGTVSIGCDRKDEIVIDSKCQNSRTSQIHVLRCVNEWGGVEHHRKHVIVEKPGNPFSAASCLIFDKRKGTLTLRPSKICGRTDAFQIFEMVSEFKLSLPQGRCFVAPKSITREYESSFNRPGSYSRRPDPTNRATHVHSNYYTVLFILVLCLMRGERL